MNVKELMLGDWVRVNGTNYRVAQLKKHGVIRLSYDNERNNHYVDFNTDFIEDDTEPIPLTEEILEKNRFEKIKDDDGEELYLITEHKIGYLPHDLCLHKRDGLWANAILNIYEVKEKLIGSPYKVFTNYEKVWVFLTNYCECGFVHELQHALKVRGIKKEIEL